jgi:hypothetical protein
MTDLERLNVSGSDEEKRLLAAARSVAVPPRVQEEVRRAVEERVRGRRRRWLLGVFGVLAAASAAAQGTGVLERVWGRGTPPPAPVVASRPPAPVVVPLPAPAVEPSPPVVAPRVRSVAQKAVVEAPPVVVQQPGLDLPTLLREPADPPAPPPPPSPGLVIARAGRAGITLAVKDDSIVGSVRGVPVSLVVGAKSLTGRIGGDAVLIHVFGTREATGTVGGRELEFSFTPTDRGLIVSASLPDVVGRVELDGDRLSFFPGCTLAARAGVYDGRCPDGSALQVALPPSFWRLPHRARHAPPRARERARAHGTVAVPAHSMIVLQPKRSCTELLMAAIFTLSQLAGQRRTRVGVPMAGLTS